MTLNPMTLPHLGRSRRIRSLRVAVPIAAIAVAAAACGGATGGYGGSASSASPSASSSSTGSGSAGNGYGGGGSTTSSGAATVEVASNGKLGKILVDSKGRTLYLFLKDSGSASSCSGACAQVWPPLTTTGTPKVGGAAKSSLLGTTKRNDSNTEVTYHGHPLYYYQGDSKPGQTQGEGLKQFGAEWYVLSPSGDKVEHPGS